MSTPTLLLPIYVEKHGRIWVGRLLGEKWHPVRKVLLPSRLNKMRRYGKQEQTESRRQKGTQE